MAALRVAAGPRTEVAILKESVMKVWARLTFDLRAEPLLMLESSFILGNIIQVKS